MRDLEVAYDRRPGTCRYCGKQFEDDSKRYPEGFNAETKESIHRADKHVEADNTLAKVPEKRKKKNIVEHKWDAET